MKNLNATKRNLLQTKQDLNLARKGHDLLEIKLGVLVLELKRTENAASEILEKLNELRGVAERAQIIAIAEMGEGKVVELFENPEITRSYEIPYKLCETCVALDEAYIARKRVIAEEAKLSKLQEIIARLKVRENRTKKRAAALRNVVIPKHEQLEKFITDRLEEHERDEMVRLKSAR